MFADEVAPLFSNDETTSVQSKKHKGFGEKEKRKKIIKGKYNHNVLHIWIIPSKINNK